MFSIELRIKAISLGAEAKAIRRWEVRLAKARRAVAAADTKEEIETDRLRLYDHRKGVLRPEARHTNLAKGFMRGLPYLRVEQKRYTDPDWNAIHRLLGRYGTYPSAQALAQTFEAWKQGAGEKAVRA